jgi:hypothetical protein
VSVKDGPLPVSALAALGAEDGRYSVTFAFDAVRCQSPAGVGSYPITRASRGG